MLLKVFLGHVGLKTNLSEVQAHSVVSITKAKTIVGQYQWRYPSCFVDFNNGRWSVC